MDWLRFASRIWYYLRSGYTTYLQFILGAFNTLTVIYFLLIRNIPNLEIVFPRFSTFVIFGLLSVIPTAILAGWMHIKGTPAWRSEVDISVEANPYNYKLAPGLPREVYAPYDLLRLKLLVKLMRHHNLLSSEDEVEIKDIEEKYKILLKGGYVGTPRARMLEKL